MKKSKIWMPILGVAGAAAAVAPLVCMTACNSIKITVNSNCMVPNISSSGGYWIIKGSFINGNTDIDKTSSTIQITTKKSEPVSPTFAEYEALGIMTITVAEGKAEIKIDQKKIAAVFPDDTITALVITVKGDKEN